LMLYEFGGFALKETFAPVWARGDGGGFALGSGGVFLVIESREHAQTRGAKPFAKLSRVVADHARRKTAGEVTTTLNALWSQLGQVSNDAPIITGATGAGSATSEERAFLASRAQHPVRATGTGFGHLVEGQFPLGIALAALSISRGKLFAPHDTAGVEVETTAAPSQIVVIGTGHWRGEGMALVEKA